MQTIKEAKNLNRIKPLLVLVETYVFGRNMVEVKPLKKCLMHVQSDNFNLFFLKVYSDGFEVNSVIAEVPYELHVQNPGFELDDKILEKYIKFKHQMQF